MAVGVRFPASLLGLVASLEQAKRRSNSWQLKCEETLPDSGTGPSAGARKTHLQRRCQLEDVDLEIPLELAAATATDLATYWSNSVRPHALRGSPFLRPPVYSSLWRLSAKFDPTTRTLQHKNPTHLRVIAQLQASHSRRFLEIELSCLDMTGTVIFRGSAWCNATKSDAKFSQVVVPPVPLPPEAADVALHRFKALEKRPRLPLVKNQEGQPTLGLVGRLSLTLDAEDVTADELANVYGRKKEGSTINGLDPGACGDIGPVLGKALGLSMQLARESARKLDLHSIEVESDPVAANSEIELCAASEVNTQVVSILVTGWLRGKDVLRFRAVFRPSIE